MNNLFFVLFLLSPITLVIGLVSPKSFERFFGRFSTRKNLSLIFGLSTILFFVLFSITVDNETAVRNTVFKQEVFDQVSPGQPAKTSEQLLEEKLRDTVDRKSGSLEISYRSLDVKNSDLDRPAGTKQIIVNLSLSSYWNKESLYRNTGRISSEIFQTVYGSNLNPYDTFIWYSAEVIDRYGNKTEDVVLVYHLDKSTFAKISWADFDQDKLCEFLRQEQDRNSDTACNTLVKIK